MPVPRVNILLDSGAFTAWRRGTQINLAAYTHFCLDNARHIERAVNLDVIPGSPGQRRTPAMVDDSASRGWKNLARMRRAGVDAIPVFHYGERLYWLDKMLGEGCGWIGLASNAMPERVAWLDKIWAHITTHGGYPSVRVHGFLETNLSIMLRYPWYSVDSSTWIRGGAYCRVPIEIDDSQKPLIVFLGPGEMKGGYSRHHFLALPSAMQARVKESVRELGFTVGQLADPTKGRDHRAAYYATFFLRRLARHSIPPVTSRNGLFESAASEHGRKSALNEHVRFFFATGWNQRDSRTLNRVAAPDRLLSYFYLATGDKDLGAYARTGLTRVRERL